MLINSLTYNIGKVKLHWKIKTQTNIFTFIWSSVTHNYFQASIVLQRPLFQYHFDMYQHIMIFFKVVITLKYNPVLSRRWYAGEMRSFFHTLVIITNGFHRIVLEITTYQKGVHQCISYFFLIQGGWDINVEPDNRFIESNGSFQMQPLFMYALSRLVCSYVQGFCKMMKF